MPLDPIDTSVTLPPSVVAAAAAAEAAHKAAYTPQPDTPNPEGTPQPDPQPDPQPQVQQRQEPQPPRRADAPVDTAGNPEHTPAYFAMKGRFEQSQQTIGSLQEQMSEIGDELVRTQALLRTNQREPAAIEGQRPTGQAPRRLVSEADVQTYGPELIDFVKRAAREAVDPALTQVAQQVRQTSQRVGQVTQGELIATLDREVPDWKEINQNPRFKTWCSLPDVYSGMIRGKLLNAAFNAANAPRVIAFLKGFLAEEQATGQLPDPQLNQQQARPAPREAAVNLESLAAPGRPKPAGGDSLAAAADKPVFTRAQIQQFYRSVQQGAYAGRDADKQRDEQAIFAAQRDGRVRG